MSIPFAHHHLHTEYSPQDAPIRLKSLVDQSKALGYKTVTVTDHGTVSSWVKLAVLCKEAGLKPIFGLEAYFTPDRNIRDGRNNYHLILLAKTDVGLRNLFYLTEQAYRTGFYYSPRVDWSLLESHGEGLICSTACISGYVPALIGEQGYEAAKAAALRFQGIFKSDFYMEVQNHGLQEENELFPQMARMANEIGAKLLATNDVHYLRRQDANTQEALMALNMDKTLKDEKRLRLDSNEFYLKSPEEMYEAFGGKNRQCIQSAIQIADECEAQLQFGKTQLPSFAIPENETPLSYLERLSRAGLRERGLEGIPAYEERFTEEMNVMRRLREKGRAFDEYFLVVWDYVDWAWKNGIRVGVGRGSGVGSLILYCLRITNLDPLKYDLLFERFLDEERNEMPDIDIDFDRERGDEVIKYVAQKYGSDHVARIMTFPTYHVAAAIKSAYRVFDPGNTWEKEQEAKQAASSQTRGQFKFKRSGKSRDGFRDETARMADDLTKFLPKGLDGRPSNKLTFSLEKFQAKPGELLYAYSVPEIRDAKARFPQIFSFAEAIEGVVQSRGQHPAGVLITKCPIVEFVPQEFAGSKNDMATAWDMVDVDKLGGIKFDQLRTKVLTVLTMCLETIKNVRGEDVDIDNVDPSDPSVLNMFSRGDTLCIFQFESDGMVKTLRDMKADRFEDVIAANALYRPGPMDYIPSFVARKHGREKITYPAPNLEPVLKNTYGIFVYQEQVMKATRVLAGFSGSEADKVRKAMGKKKMDLLGQMKDKFLKGCAEKQTCPSHVAASIWETMFGFAEYAFNKSMDEDTVIPLSDGSYKKMKDVKEGDVVFCRNKARRKTTEVVKVHDHGFIDGVEITFDDGQKEVCSLQHKFLTRVGMKPLFEILRDGLEIIANRAKNLAQKTSRRGLAVRRIVSVRPVGKRHMLDLEVRDNSHCFELSNGVITSNSHAAAYAYTAYQCAYLKHFYPVEYMAAQMTVESGVSTTLARYEHGARSMGIRLLPLDVNKSKGNYTVEGTKEKLAIRRGFKGVKGLGRAYLDIEKGQPYKNMFDYCLRSGEGVKKDVVEAIIDSGGFDWLLPGMTTLIGRQATKADIIADYADKSVRAKREKNLKGARKEEKEGIKSVFDLDDESSSSFSME